uniref:Uncharacterized protein n=1 Tax=Panagrolaimus sp. ES5 TaxID=591445 RepID=A0AC34G0Y2_9BILA
MASRAYNYDNNIFFNNNVSIKIMNEVKTIFFRHGLHERIPDNLISYDDNFNTNLQIPVMDRNGRIFALSSDLHQTFALYSAEKSSCSCFAFGSLVNYQDESPRQTTKCAVDMMAPLQHVSFIESDFCSLITDLMNHISTYTTVKYTFRISHAKLFEALVEIHHWTDDLTFIKKHFSSFSFGGVPCIVDCDIGVLNALSKLTYEEKIFEKFRQNLITMQQSEENLRIITEALKEIEDFAKHIEKVCGKKNILL